MIDFDPWTATLEEAQRQPNAYELRGAVIQCVAAHELTASKDRIVAGDGDGFGVLQAVAKCAVADLVMPDWLAKAFLKRFRAVQQCKVDSWDAKESFGRPYPKGTQISALHRKQNNRVRVILAVSDAVNRNPEQVIDVAFWEEIGQLVGEGKTNAQKLHAEAVRLGWAVAPSVRKNKLLGKSNPAT